MGLKENVIIGKLIPAGAGLTAYREMAGAVVPDLEPPAEPEEPEPLEEETDVFEEPVEDGAEEEPELPEMEEAEEP